MRLPEMRFFLFGMGGRRKLLYLAGVLSDAITNEVLREWDIASEQFDPPECRVTIQPKSGDAVTISEDDSGVWLEEGGKREALSESPLKLPRFEGHPHADLLRVLHHELLVNVVDAGPVPNYFVYDKPWLRDAAMMCMCFEKTGNLHVVKDWILGLNELYDRNNAGNEEPDNLGQVLYMISLVSDRSHPLLEKILAEIPKRQVDNHIVGLTDGAERPVYQTKWLKFGLRALGLDDPYEIPAIEDRYSLLFWWDYKDQHVPCEGFGERGSDRYPYLAWAEANFHQAEPPMALSSVPYPITWEAHASEADYAGMAPIDAEYVEQKVSAPHTWHAAEMFLYLLERGA